MSGSSLRLTAAALLAGLIYGRPLPLGGLPPMPVQGRPRRSRNKVSNTRAYQRRRERDGKARKRLQIARGAGSISAKADILQLTRARRWTEAADMAEQHRRQCGERLLSDDTLAVWRQCRDGAQP